jgi:hypothetical protein
LKLSTEVIILADGKGPVFRHLRLSVKGGDYSVRYKRNRGLIENPEEGA